MENINATIDLKGAILLMETEQLAKGLELKEQFNETYKNINPLNLIKETLKGEDTAPGILESMIISGAGMATGYITRKIFVGQSANIFRKILGTAIQVGATRVIAKNAQTIKVVGQVLFEMYTSQKKHSNRKQH